MRHRIDACRRNLVLTDSIAFAIDCVGHLSAPRSKYMGHFQAFLLLQIMVSQVHYILNPTQQTLYIGY